MYLDGRSMEVHALTTNVITYGGKIEGDVEVLQKLTLVETALVIEGL